MCVCVCVCVCGGGGGGGGGRRGRINIMKMYKSPLLVYSFVVSDDVTTDAKPHACLYTNLTTAKR